MPYKPLLAATAISLFALPALSAEAGLQIVLTLEGDAQRDLARYECEGRDEPIAVSYINAHPNFLALVPVDGETLVFVNVTAASGARYVAGQYEWWSQGNDATLTDLHAGEDAEPLACHAALDIP